MENNKQTQQLHQGMAVHLNRHAFCGTYKLREVVIKPMVLSEYHGYYGINLGLIP